MARHSTSTAAHEQPADRARCSHCESGSCRSCAQYRLHAWRLTGESGLSVEQAAGRMGLPMVRVEYLLAVERDRRDLQNYAQRTIPVAAARAVVDRHLEQHPELTRAALARYMCKRQIDFDRQLGYTRRPDGTIQQTIGITAASELMIALGDNPNDLDGC